MKTESQNDSIIYYFMRVELPRYNLSEEPVHACLYGTVLHPIPVQYSINSHGKSMILGAVWEFYLSCSHIPVCYDVEFTLTCLTM